MLLPWESQLVQPYVSLYSVRNSPHILGGPPGHQLSKVSGPHKKSVVRVKTMIIVSKNNRAKFLDILENGGFLGSPPRTFEEFASLWCSVLNN